MKMTLLKSILLPLFTSAVFALATPAKAAHLECASAEVDASGGWEPSQESGLSLWGGPDNEGYAFLFLGAIHSFDPHGAQPNEVKRLFKKFSPTLVIFEGGKAAPPTDQTKAIRETGEMGLVQWLAERCKIENESFDSSVEYEVTELLTEHNATEVKVYLLARLIPQFKAQNRPITDIERYLTISLRNSDIKGEGLVDVRPTSILEFEQEIRKALPDISRWQDIEYKHVAPIDHFNSTELGILNRMATQSLVARDNKLIAQARAGLSRGHRVLVMAGTSHMLNVMKRMDFSSFSRK